MTAAEEISAARADWGRACRAAAALGQQLLEELTADPLVEAFDVSLKNELVITLDPRELAVWESWCARFSADTTDAVVHGTYLVVTGRSRSGVSVRLRGRDVAALLAAAELESS